MMKNSLEIAKKYFKYSNESNLEKIEKMFTEKTIYSSQNTGIFSGTNQIMEMMRPFFKSFKTLKWEIKSIKEISENIILFDFIFSGEKIDGKKVSFEGLEYVVLSEGKIQHIDIRNK